MVNIEEHLNELLGVVREADQAIMDVYGAPGEISFETKPDDSPVTEADIASHHILIAGLSRLFPKIPIVSEEGDERINIELVKSKRFLLVDPLDGTREYLARSGHFTVCAALIEDDYPSFGMISAPALGVTYYGGPNMGSYRISGSDSNATPIRVAEHNLGVVLGSRSDLNKETADYIAEHYPGSKIRAVGSQLKLPQIAEGLADAYPRINGPLHLWDLAAGQAILVGAGGSVTRPNGEPIDYHADSLLAGDFVARARN